jgi:CRP-like cAMP-binding protein
MRILNQFEMIQDKSASKLWYFQNINFLKAMTNEEKMELSRCSVMKEIRRDEHVYLPQDLASRIYFLKEGSVKIVSYSEDGRELIHALLNAGQIFGELALAGEERRENFAMVTEDAKVCQVGVGEFERILKSNPLLNLEVTKLIGFRLKRIRTRLERMWFKSAEQRIRSLLMELAEDYGTKVNGRIVIALRLKHHEIASLAATTRQTATSVLNSLVKAGAIEYDRRKIILKKTLL